MKGEVKNKENHVIHYDIFFVCPNWNFKGWSGTCYSVHVWLLYLLCFTVLFIGNTVRIKKKGHSFFYIKY